jgi:hypothetical protein
MGAAGPVGYVDQQPTDRREHLMALARRLDPQPYGFVGFGPVASVAPTFHIQTFYTRYRDRHSTSSPGIDCVWASGEIRQHA